MINFISIGRIDKRFHEDRNEAPVLSGELPDCNSFSKGYPIIPIIHKNNIFNSYEAEVTIFSQSR